MVAAALTAFLDPRGVPPDGIIVSAVLPGGCPLDCPFCIVQQRDERRLHSELTPDHYSELLRTLSRRSLLGGAAIVGDEPLQTNAWPYANAFLSTARYENAPMALISNGYELASYVSDLEAFEGIKLLVSLDGIGEHHDASRRKKGAFSKISQGIEAAAQSLLLRETLSIATILMPSTIPHIQEIITYAAAHSVSRVMLSPLLVSTRSQALHVQARVMEQAWKVVPEIIRIANQMGVELRLTDEFGILNEWEDRLLSIGVEILKPRGRVNLIRVDAAGRIETLETLCAGVSTGLCLPANPRDIHRITDEIIALTMQPTLAAA